MSARVRAAALIGLAALCVLAFHALGEEYYASFHIPQWGMDWLLPQELAQAALFALLGTAALALLTAGLLGTPLPERLLAIGQGLLRRPWLAAASGAVFVLAASLVIRHLVLRHAPICDDENTYRFIAQTLEQGALVAPSPGGDLPFYREQFVVLTDTARYGKYPIGYPLLLTVGRLVGAESLVVPILTAGLVLLTMLLGRAVYDARTAALGALLLALSPQVVATGGTWLSQPASAVCLAIALVCLLAMAGASGGRRVGWAAGAGLALGYGVLVRPLPGVLFVGVALLHLALEQRARRFSLATWAALLAPLAAGGAVLVLVNRAQTGQALFWAYQAAHGGVPIGAFMKAPFARRVSSVVGTLVRLDHWFLGWPLALALCLLARRNARARLLWSVVGAEIAYRLLSPKTGVGTAGPLYAFEALPALALLAADGLRQIAVGKWPLGGLLPARRLAAVLPVAGAFIGITMFLPPRLGDLTLAGSAHHVAGDLLAAGGIHHALVFHENIVPPRSGLSWAYGPRNNGPALDDDILFVNFWRGRPDENRKFWQRRHPDRRPLYFGYEGGGPLLLPLEEYIERLQAAPTAKVGTR